MIAEALCAGLPVIASAVGGIPALLTDLETALLVPPADTLALSAAIERLLGSPDLRERLRHNGRVLIRNNGLEAQRERMIRVIRQEVMPDARHPFLSALADYPHGAVPEQPTVSAVIPVYDEIAYIRSVVEGLLAQDYPALTEIWFVDGQSDDGTWEALQRIKGYDPRMRVLSNPRRNQAAGINLAFSQIQSDVVIRLDAHAEYAPDAIRQSVQALLETGAGGVGAIARPLVTDTLIGQSIAAAHESRLGVGVAKFRQDSTGGWVDTVWNGCYWKHVVDRVGPLREDLPRTEDNDFNARVRAMGYGLYLAPSIKASYYPRQSLRELWRQYIANGAGVARTCVENRQAIGLRHLVPLAFVASLLLLLAVSVVWPPAWLALAPILLSYVAALLLFSIIAWRKRPGLHVVLLPVVFVALHVSYGLGSIRAFSRSHTARSCDPSQYDRG